MTFTLNEQQVLSSLTRRTLVNGRSVPTGPIAADVGISQAELAVALDSLSQRGWVRVEGGTLATITPEGHAHLADEIGKGA
jgi:DNA-binding MarR family transcriptional regulator